MPSKRFAWPLMSNNVTRDDLDSIIKYLSSDDPRLTNGPAVESFEDAWSKWLGVDHTVMVNSGSSANDVSMLALRYLRGNGQVIVPPLTWVSDIASVLHAGLEPVFVDIELATLAPSAENISAHVTNETRAVFLTHVLGINAITEQHRNLFDSSDDFALIEDVSESHGAMAQERLAGSLGWLSNFSFYYAHHMTTMEGGAICTSDPAAYETLRMLRSHGLVREIKNDLLRSKLIDSHPDLNSDFIFRYAGHNMRPIEIQGILGLAQLKHLDERNKSRKRNFELFLRGLDESRFLTELALQGQCNYAFILILREKNLAMRDRIESTLHTQGVEFRRGLSGGGNQLRQPYLKEAGFRFSLDKFPNVEHVHHFAWYIGNYPEISTEQIHWLCELLNTI